MSTCLDLYKLTKWPNVGNQAEFEVQYTKQVHIDHAPSVVFTEQDTGLEALSSVIGRQKQMALDLGNEVDDQNGNGCYRWEA